MAIDASIYGNMGRLAQVETPNFGEAMQRGLTLSHLALQGRQAARGMQDQQAIRDAYAKNVGADGKLNQEGVLSELAKTSPSAMQQIQEHFNKAGKDVAEADKSKAESAQKILSMSMPVMERLAGMAPDQRATEFPKAMAYLTSLGVPMHGVPQAGGQPVYDDNWFSNSYLTGKKMKDHLDSQKTLADTGRSNSDTDISQRKAPLERAKLGAEISKLNGDTAGQRATIAGDLRKERSGLPTTKATQEVSAAYNRVQSAAKNPSAAGDLSLIFGYMKMLDPGSTVREGEFATAQNAAGVPSQLLNVYERVRSGQRLSPEQRADFLGQAQGLYGSQNSQQSKIDKDYERLAIKQGVSPDDVLMNFGADVPGASPQMLAVGDKGGGIIPSANAGVVAPRSEAIAPQGVRMMGPDGSIRVIPQSLVGEAIAAGGRKVK